MQKQTPDIITQLQDLTHLSWTEHRSSSGTSGMLLKAREGDGAQTTFFKMSSYDEYRGIYGHECVNELVAARLLKLLGFEHLPYRLIHAQVQLGSTQHVTWVSASQNFRKPGERKQAFDLFYSLNKQSDESPWDFACRMGWRRQIENMMLADYLIANRDRHGANIEVLRAKDGSLRLAPLFDNGLSLVFSAFGIEEAAAAFDPLADVQANNYIGSHSLQYNIEHFNVRPQVNALRKSDKGHLLQGLDQVLPQAHMQAIWNMIWKRWQWYEGFCNR